MNDPRKIAGKELVRDLRHRIEQFAGEESGAGYMRQMWNYVLDARERGQDPVPTDRCDAVPYVPVEPEAFGTQLSAEGAVLDVGCLGGYGLYDFTCRRRMAGKPVPRLFGIDADAVSVRVAREMASLWGEGLEVDFQEARAEKLPFADQTFDLAIARLLLPYVDMRAALGELDRVLKASGLAVFQIHAFRYYRDEMFAHLKHPITTLYYLRALLSGTWFRVTGRQPRHRWFAETALNSTTLVRMCAGHGLQPVWRGEFVRKPIVVFRKTLAGS